MEHENFDRLTRALARHAPRRRFGGILLALGIGAGTGFNLLGAAETGAKKKRRKKCKGNKKKCGKKCILKTQCCKAADCGEDGSCQGGTCQCPAGKKPCRGTCIADTSCCDDAECGAGRLCADGGCVTGQGTCPAQSDACVAVVECKINNAPTPNCVCFRTTSGEIRCGANDLLGLDTCETDADCAQLFPGVSGVFCAEGGGNCPFSSICQAPCAE